MAIDINIESQVSQTITDGVTDKAPSENAVFDALALKIGGAVSIGQVAFGTASGVGGDSQLFWDNTNKRLGVGTSPSFQLEVFGSASEKARFRDSDSIYNGVVIMADLNAGWIGNNTTFASEGFYLQNNISAIRTFVGGLERTRLTTSSFGIFTPSPTQTLDVNGTCRIRNGVSLADVSGNVAIGTTSPTARLHVQSQGALSTDIAFRVRNSANTLDLLSVKGNGTINARNLPTSATGLVAGDIWNDAGTLKIV